MSNLDRAIACLGNAGADEGVRMLVGAILRTPKAMALFWGTEGILVYNDACRALLGARDRAAFGNPVREAWPQHGNLHAQAMDKVRTGQSVSVRGLAFNVVVDRAAHPRTFDVDYSPVCDTSGKPCGTLAVFSETASPVDGATALSRDDAFGRVHRMATVGELTAGVAHEFNNLLQGILGSVQVVRKLIESGRTGETERFTAAALSAALRAGALTERLLSFARAPRESEPQPVDVNQLIASMEDLLRTTQTSSVRVEFALADGLWKAPCNPVRLAHAIVDLLIDARAALHDAGTIAIETANVEVIDDGHARADRLAPGKYVCISAVHTPSGAEHVLLRDQDPPALDGEGAATSGIGLAMAVRFAREAGGNVSTQQQGSHGAVRLCVPRDARAEATTSFPS